MSKMNIAVFFGSRSCEHDVSIVSALQCIEATKAAGFNVTPVYISRDGLWYTGEPLENIETFREFNPMTKGITRVTLDVTANAGDLWAWPPQRAGLFAKVPAPLCHIDCVIPVFHGWHGEDGTIQGLLEMANIPYASSGVLGSAIGMDKIAMKQILRGAGFPVLDFVWFTREQLKKERQAVIERVEKEIKYPAFIKPAALGSSIGVSRAKNREELERARKFLSGYPELTAQLAAAAKAKRINEHTNPAYRWVALAIVLAGAAALVYGIISWRGGSDFGVYFALFGFAAVFFFSGAHVLPTAKNNRRAVERAWDKAQAAMANVLPEDFPLPARYAHPIVLDRMIRILREGRAQSKEEALDVLKADLRALTADVQVEQEEHDEVVVIKPLFLVSDYQ